MGTIVEAKYVKTLLHIAEEMHSTVFSREVKRVLTTIKIDNRRDTPLSIEGKVKSVRRHLKTVKRHRKPMGLIAGDGSGEQSHNAKSAQ